MWEFLLSICEIHTPQEVVQGKYAVTSLYNIEPSHIPPSFSANPKYPKGCNERDYTRNAQEQGKVIKYANVFNPKFLINDDNTPENGAIIVDENGIVLGGNGRTMTLHLVVSEFRNFGINTKVITNCLLKKRTVSGLTFLKLTK